MESGPTQGNDKAPIAVVMITLNEGHNMDGVLQNIKDWAQEIFLIDSYSSDATVDIALEHGAHVVQRKFSGFGDQWNFALRELPISAPWTMKLDPDERFSEDLKANISSAIDRDSADGLSLTRRLWFMQQPLPVRQTLIRVWRTGSCEFTDVSVNEHPIIKGSIEFIEGELEHHDSPNLHHWVEKQNKYSSMEAISRMKGAGLAAAPRLLGNTLERRMWLKKHWRKIPLRYRLYAVKCVLDAKPWLSGHAGMSWARSRVWVRRLIEEKLIELQKGAEMPNIEAKLGDPHPHARQAD